MQWTRTAIITAATVTIAAGIVLGIVVGRAYQRAVDAWYQVRYHWQMTRLMWSNAWWLTGEAFGVIAAAVLVLGAGAVAAWVTLH